MGGRNAPALGGGFQQESRRHHRACWTLARISRRETGGAKRPCMRPSRGTKNPAVITALLDAGADLKARTKQGTLLWPMTSPCIGLGVSKTGQNPPASGPPFHHRVCWTPARTSRRRNEHGETPLHRAAVSNYEAAGVTALLDAGADIEARDRWGRTPLHHTAGAGWHSPGVITALLDAGADIKARDGNGQTPLHKAAAIDTKPAGITALLVAGADPKARDADGMTPWDLAPKGSNAYWLLGDPKARDERGATPLHYSVRRYRNPAIIAWLLASGADIEARTEQGETPLHHAAGHLTPNNPAFITALLDAGADIEAQDEHGATPLHYSVGGRYFAIYRNPAIIAVLLDAGADIEARDRWGRTPLHWAALFSKNPAVITALLDAGADPKARNANGQTPWDHAKDNEALKGSDAYWRLNDARF